MNTDLIQQYDQWNEKKKGLQKKLSSNDVYFNERDV